MSHRIASLLAGFGLLFSVSVQATTYVPIVVGDITVIIPIDDPPVAQGDSAIVDEDTQITIDVLANDSDENVATLAIEITGQKEKQGLFSTLSVVDNQVVYQAPQDWNGEDWFTYTLTDEHDNVSEEVTVTVAVSPVNDAPVGVTDVISIGEDDYIVIDVLANDYDVDGDTLRIERALEGYSNIEIHSGATRVGVKILPGDYEDFTARIVYDLTDGITTVDDVEIFLKIQATNFAPVAYSGNSTLDEDTVLRLNIADLGEDPDGDPITLAIDSVSQGTAIVAASGDYIEFTPIANFYGTARLVYTLSDGVNTTTGTHTISVQSVNDAPVAEPDNAYVYEDTQTLIDVLANDHDADGDSLSIVASSLSATHGTVSVEGDQISYTPAAGYNGNDTVTYNVTDGMETGFQASFVDVTVVEVNDAPVAVSRQVPTSEDIPVTFELTANDEDSASLSFTVISAPTHGQLIGTTPNLTYTPDSNFNGVDSLTFVANDGLEDSGQATVTFNVSSVNDAPVAVSRQVPTSEGMSVAFELTATDVDSTSLSFTVTSAPTQGQLTGTAPNLTYTPSENFNGIDSLTFIANDGLEDSAQATITLNVASVNDVPVFDTTVMPISSLQIEQAFAFQPEVSDVDNDELTFAITNLPDWIDFDSATGALSGTPSIPDIGSYQNIQISVNDGNGGSDTLPAFDIEVLAELVSVEITNPAVDTSQDYSDIVVEASVSDEAQTRTVFFQFNGGEWLEDTDGAPWGMTFSNVIAGTNTVQAKVENLSGATSESSVRSVYLEADFSKRAGTVNDATLTAVNETTSTYFGAVEGKGGVSGGAATYQIPIVVPPGRNNMTPSVSVNYSSRAGAGVLGVGWQLSAFDTISRCGAIAAIDGFTRNVAFDASTDKLCYGGERLIVVSGNYGTAGAIYRTEIDQFARITQSNAINASDASFTVEHKNGLTETYGGTTDSRFAPDGSEVLTWGLSSRSDQSGNRIEYNYSTAYSKQLLIEQIDYTLHDDLPGAETRSVQFFYDDTSAAQASYAYIAGLRTESSAKLTHIKTYVDTDLIRDYQFGYDSSTSNGRLLLDDITLCVENGSVCTATTDVSTYSPALSWDASELVDIATDTLEFVEPSQSGNPNRYLLKDIDGDGLSEMIAMHFNITAGSVQGVEAKVLKIGSGGSYVVEATFNGDEASALISGVTGDLNEDGITDFIAYENSQLVTYQYDNATQQLDHSNLGHALSSGYTNLNSTNTQVMDLDGDGLQDIVLSNYLNSAGDKIIAYYQSNMDSQGDISYTFHNILTLDSGTDALSNLTVHESSSWQDINGDGIQDAVLNFTLNSQTRLNIRLGQVNQGTFSLGAALSTSTTNLPANPYLNQYTFADLNGDGLRDFVIAREGSTEGSVDGWYVQINTGDGSFADEASLGTATGLHAWSDQIERQEGDDLDGYNPEHRYRTQAMFGGLVVGDFDVDGQDELLVATGTNDDYCVVIEGDKTGTNGENLGELFIASCGDQIHKSNHINTEDTGTSSLTNAKLSHYDLRRFNWTLLDFEAGSSLTSPVLRTQYDDVVSAPLANTAFYDGDTLQSLNLKDFNNDGYLDFSYQTLTGGTLTEADFTVGGNFITNGAISAVFNSNAPQNGVYVQSSALKNVADGRLVDMAWKIDDGIGNVHQWEYSNISTPTGPNEPARYYVPSDRDARYTGDFTRDYFYFTSSMPMVTTYKAPNGNGAQNDYEYYYREAVFNRKGRGFQGFRSILIDNPDGTRSETDFHQVFPLTGKIEQSRICEQSQSIADCTSNPLKTNEISYHTTNTTSSGTLWVIADEAIETQYALHTDRAQILQKTTTVDTSSLNSNYGQVKDVTVLIDDGFGTTENHTNTVFYASDEDNWWINKVEKVIVTSSARSGDPRAVYTANSALDSQTQIETLYTYTAQRLPDTVIVDVKIGDGKTTTTDNDYTTAGAINTITLQAQGESSDRVQQFFYDTDSEYYFPDQIINAENHRTTIETDKAYGQPTLQTDVNGVETSYTYDGFGRITSTQTETMPVTYIAYVECSACEGQSSDYITHYIETKSAGSPAMKVYRDSLGRERLKEMQNRSGDVFTRTLYDDLNRVTFQSQPAFSSSSSHGTHFSDFDVLGRPQQKTVSQATSILEISYTYHAGGDAHRTKIEANSLPEMYRTHSGTGLLIKTTDAIGGETQYAYDGRNNPMVIRDANNVDITAQYNALSQKVSVVDPNQGTSEYTYTGFGELYTQTDAKGQIRRWAYDGLGRQLTLHLDGVLQWTNTYDSADRGNSSEHCLGMAASQTVNRSGENFSESYEYDSYCRLLKTHTSIDGSTYTTETQYDGNYGRPKAMVYPTNLVVGFEYDAQGMQSRIFNAESDYTYQQISEMDAYNNWTQATYAGGNSSVERFYFAKTGQMEYSRFRDGGSLKQEVIYSYDSFGNLATQTVNRHDVSIGLVEESYDYDDLHRLETATIAVDGTALPAINYDYDAVGNIKKKTDFSTDNDNAYQYGSAARNSGNAGPNAVRTVSLGNGAGTRTYGYDLNGNLTSDGLRTITYNADNLPTQIVLSSGRINPVLDSVDTAATTIQFGYTPALVRYRQNVVGKRDVHYVGKHYEKIFHTGGEVEQRFYIGDVAILTEKDEMVNIGFTHKDRLGSSIGISDNLGRLKEVHSFDAFGRPRGGEFDYGETQIFDSEYTNQGFTGHEQLNDVQLTHMNGRVYDYNLGRFLSVDPFIQGFGDSQGINPYSYIMNNPLAGTDPSGYNIVWFTNTYVDYIVWREENKEHNQQVFLSMLDSMDPRQQIMDIGEGLSSNDPLEQTAAIMEIAALASTASLAASMNRHRGNGADSRVKNDANNSADIGQQSSKEETEIGDFLVGDKRSESRQHAQEASEAGCCLTGVWDPDGADARRRQNLRGVPTEKGKDRDEFPPASIELDDSSKQSVKLIDSSDNRSSGSGLRHEIRQKNIQPGDRVKIKVPAVARVNGRIDSRKLRKLEEQK